MQPRVTIIAFKSYLKIWRSVESVRVWKIDKNDQHMLIKNTFEIKQIINCVNIN